MAEPEVVPNHTAGARVNRTGPGAWRLQIPPGTAGRYRLAQVDDYSQRRRDDFTWRAPMCLRLEARASHRVIPGTWGFGLWNDPFSMSLLGVSGAKRLPCLPSTAWFFGAASPSHLSLRDDLPAQGFLAATFRSPRPSGLLLAQSLLALPLLALPITARLLRQTTRRVVQQDAAQLDLDPTEWHTYQIRWQDEQVDFFVDERLVLRASVSPTGPLGLVLWVDNQYAAFPPNGRVRYGTLPNPEPAWVEIRNLDAALDKRPTYE